MKYKLTEETCLVREGSPRQVMLYRIRALRDIVDAQGTVLVRAGEKGGFVQSELNLSHEGACWVFHDAKVYDRARVEENGQIREQARACDESRIAGNAIVSGEAFLSVHARAIGEARAEGSVVLKGKACIDRVVYNAGCWYAPSHDERPYNIESVPTQITICSL